MVCFPLFEAIKKEERTIETIRKIMNVLRTRFYVNGSSYQFKVSDRRWGHVGYYRPNKATNEKNIVLFDLADLEIKETTSEAHEDYVKDHIKVLCERACLTDDFFSLPRKVE